MATRNRKSPKIPFKSPGKTALAPTLAPGDRTIFLTYLQELYQSIHVSMDKLGATPNEQQAAFKSAAKGKKTKGRPAKEALRRSQAMGEILTHWTRDERYTIDGEPRALPIRGRGISIESLAKKFAPGMKPTEVVNALVKHGEVQRLKGGKVALQGTTMIVPPKTAELTLATIVIAYQRNSESILRNATVADIKIQGLPQRFVMGRLSFKQFQRFLSDMKPGLKKYLEGIDTQLRSLESQSRNSRDCGFAMVTFFDE